MLMTGAGISAESGISTFRDPNTNNHPLWSRYDPMELAHIDAFHRDPELVTRWYHWRFGACKDARPNPGHEAIARLQQILPAMTLSTQNVDGLHQRAGSTDVIELHGCILRWKCTQSDERTSIEQISFDSFPPRSPAGGLWRPDVVWFGEMLPELAIERTQAAATSCDLFFSIGTSSVVYPAAGYFDLARSQGTPTIEINPDATPASEYADVVIRSPAGEALPELIAAAFPEETS